MIPVPGFEGRRVAVFGLGRSGITAARALKAGGATPVLWDDGVSGRLQAQAEGFIVEDLTAADWSGFAALVLSPGAPLTHPKPHWTVDKAREAGVPVVGDIELFARALDALPEGRRPWVIAITGTNGKSTTTALIGWVLQQAGLTVHVGGNIGIGVLALPEPTPGAVYVIEVSSYQLDLTTRFAPDAAILTNISPDHLDRHGGMEGYVAAKRRIFQSRKTAPYVGIDDPYGFAIWQELKAEGRAVDPVSVERPMDDDLGMYLMDDWLTYNAGGRPAPIVDLSKARSLPGRHNAQNAAFAFLAVNDMGIPEETVVKGLLTFPGLAHRMEAVGHIGPVRFINDSKATNADAARQALSSYPKVFWIAGGKPKDGGIDDLADLFPRVAKAYLIGEAAEAFAATLGDTPHVISKTMDAAAAAAAADAQAAGGDQIVLLSPACASFDQYPDFEVRGEAFRAAVLALGATPETAR
ncbi:MAG: UDP-N-acetylmuramoyl-L-alanine--D-glutamate ligase [Alphaproteobacteria bacterium]|uniref:UDP-N-acetylmuramoyl-L-alanine--D-glutamate ligase n=1 Tax=Brevundimonas sp. TaxID=1871086 RepID=UPI000DB3E170|nr:UDP-N-acetylmuramoyl-L-alanine--D-glutamate ligase [Alphaproteobacteria bacterium]MBU1521063.1 UDP-N-acetylmuramoyl-L-alanine--D-glutamate ligase [Alphaproteobacteria bacterium]MBU2028989.1 UDP-N-acetylmuramoyl-L-alanine--D-glutamate ligase [Alphaproteobacteria bacterium]MBU2165043.1 UDP-N-acetylmuramoyl-L-alanine--D-glutamate ligase [Alphaproteobacteria bacterium]MBU2231699.1 UDP-N-acetylmuramoyl-L-alanine--D-glutamate ligase [Alphaproteobacteria bacterium]